MQQPQVTNPNLFCKLPQKIALSAEWRSLSKKATDLYIILLSYSDGKFKPVFPSIDKLSGKSNIPRRTVFHCLKQLESVGLIQRVKTPKRSSNTYIFLGLSPGYEEFGFHAKKSAQTENSAQLAENSASATDFSASPTETQAKSADKTEITKKSDKIKIKPNKVQSDPQVSQEESKKCTSLHPLQACVCTCSVRHLAPTSPENTPQIELSQKVSADQPQTQLDPFNPDLKEPSFQEEIKNSVYDKTSKSSEGRKEDTCSKKETEEKWQAKAKKYLGSIIGLSGNKIKAYLAAADMTQQKFETIYYTYKHCEAKVKSPIGWWHYHLSGKALKKGFDYSIGKKARKQEQEKQQKAKCGKLESAITRLVKFSFWVDQCEEIKRDIPALQELIKGLEKARENGVKLRKPDLSAADLQPYLSAKLMKLLLFPSQA